MHSMNHLQDDGLGSLTEAVTLGLPSRSPPIHDPKMSGVASMGSSRPVCFFRAILSLRRNAGTAAHKDCSTMCSPPLASVAPIKQAHVDYASVSLWRVQSQIQPRCCQVSLQSCQQAFGAAKHKQSAFVSMLLPPETSPTEVISMVASCSEVLRTYHQQVWACACAAHLSATEM